jgi:hypothetical protein
MAIQGSQLVTRIQSMVQVNGREKHKEFSMQFGSLIRREHSGLNLGSEADLLFDVFRKCRRDETSSPQASNLQSGAFVDGVEETLWRETRQGWGVVDKNQLALLYAKTRASFESILTDFNSSRSRATHVLALFRPFQDRYFQEWVLSVSPYPKTKIEQKISRLRESFVSDKIELSIWANEVFELFQESAVFYPETQEIIQKDPNRKGSLPLGMISSQSVRVYGQQWRLWIREYENEILASQETTSGSIKIEANDLGAAPQALIEVLPEQRLAEHVAIEIEVSPDGDDSLLARKSWNQRENAELTVKNWVTATGQLWSVHESRCKAVIKSWTGDATSEMSVKAQDFETLAGMVESYIKNL